MKKERIRNLNKKSIVLAMSFTTFSMLEMQGQQALELQSVKRTKYDITAKYDSGISPKTEEFIYKYKVKIEMEMQKIIGFAPEALNGGEPESPLMNFTADALKVMAEKLTKSKVDMSVINSGGLRTSLRKGPITVRNVFQIYPFENRIVVVTMKGKDLRELFEFLSKKGIGGIGSASLVIKGGKIEKVKIDGKPIVDELEYRVATIDYLVEGNDGMVSFKKSYHKIDTKVILRTGIMDYIKDQTRKKLDITGKTDQRVVILN